MICPRTATTLTISSNQALLQNVCIIPASTRPKADSVQALHALCLTDVALCMPPQDAAKYVRCLAPYLKVAPLTARPRSADKDRRDAACLLCKLVGPLLHVLCMSTH